MNRLFGTQSIIVRIQVEISHAQQVGCYRKNVVMDLCDFMRLCVQDRMNAIYEHYPLKASFDGGFTSTHPIPENATEKSLFLFGVPAMIPVTRRFMDGHQLKASSSAPSSSATP